jgi:glycosyltransferase involved in cell wall biosynthesis
VQLRDAERTGALKFETLEPKPDARAGEGVRAPRKPNKRLAFVIAHLGSGGAQRVAANAANALAARGINLDIILVGENKNIFPLDPRITLHLSPRGGEEVNDVKAASANALPAKHRGSGWRARLRRLLAEGTAQGKWSRPLLMPVLYAFLGIDLVRQTLWLRREVKDIRADAVLSFLTQTNILTILATRGLKTRTVISERNDPALQTHRPGIALLRRLFYRHADLVTANSRGALRSMESYVPRSKLAFLPNPLSIPKSSVRTNFAAPTIITVGRLVEQKGLDVLLAAWAKAAPQIPQWRLAMVGEGPLRAELEALARQLGIEESVDWHGHVADPFPLMRGAEFFLLTSRFEGSPNALLEAMACGLPGIVSDASPGPIELVGVDESAGLIVPVEDVDATANAIARLAGDETLRRMLAAEARERVREYETDQALKVWLELLACA